MKKHLSIFGLFARQTLLPTLGILILISGIQWISFQWHLRHALNAYGADIGGAFPQLEVLLPRSAANIWFALGYLLITALLCLIGCQFRTQTNYTLRRLSVGERTVFLWQWLYNALIYLLLWLWQVVLSYGLCLYYLNAAPTEATGVQTLFLAFWRSEFLHALLPLTDVALWVRNGFWLIALSLAAAIFPYRQRRGKYSGSAIALIPYVCITFERGIAEWAHVALTVTIAVLVLTEAIGGVWLTDDDKDSASSEEVNDHA